MKQRSDVMNERSKPTTIGFSPKIFYFYLNRRVHILCFCGAERSSLWPGPIQSEIRNIVLMYTCGKKGVYTIHINIP